MTAETQIDQLTADFFAEFDNRGGRRPSAQALRQMFAVDARITRIAGDRIEVLTPTEFIDPRIDLLTHGDLSDFHEWEIAGRTFILGDIATRASTYAKAGIANGEIYEGTGRKVALFHRKSESWQISSLLWQDD